MTETVINPQTVVGGYGTITVTQISSSNSETFQTTFFSVRMVCTVAINVGDYLFLTFPEGFNNFNDLDMEGDITIGAAKKTFTASSTNTKLGFAIPAGSAIPASTPFTISISSLPTPKASTTIDMNKLIITLTPPTRTTTKASSLQLHNQVSSSTFTTS
jgi:hypothetical protein